jgi:hypothetical protein
MKTLISILLLICLTQHANAQIEWQHCYGGTASDECNAIRQTFDSGYILAGYATSDNDDVSGNHAGEDFWVVKITATGAIEWQKSYGGSDNDEAFDVRQTADSGYVVVGSTQSTDGDVSGNHGVEDMWVIKISSSGVLQWQKCLGGSGDDAAQSVGQTNDGGYIVAGSTNSNDGDVTGNHGNYDEWVIKLNSTGSIVWERCYGGSSSDGAASVQQTYDGGYIVGGGTASDDGDVTGNHGAGDIWVLKLSPTNSIEWEKCLGNNGADDGSFAIQTSDSGYIVAGQTWSGGGDVTGYIGLGSSGGDGWVVKLSDTGAIQWDRCVYVSGGDYIHAVQQTSEGGYIIAGSETPYMARANGIFGKLSGTGVIDWVDTISTSTYFASAVCTNDGYSIAAGYATQFDVDVSDNHGLINYLVVKFGAPTGVSNIHKTNDFTITPNPATQYLNITASINITSISITNILGQQVFSGKCKSSA